MTPDSAVGLVSYALTGLVAAATLAVLLRPLYLPLWRLFRGTQQFLEDWHGEPARPDAGVPPRPGAMARLAQLERNSGSTMRDDVSHIKERLEQVAEAAAQATTAAGIAVGEARAGRAVMAEAAENNRRQIGELRGTVSGLINALDADEQQRRKKEAAYVAALNHLGVPLTPIVDELDDVTPDHEPDL